MNRQTAIGNLNAKYINNTIAHNLLPVIPQQNQSSFFQNNNYDNQPPLTAETQTMPYSISAAQRNSTLAYNQVQDPHAAHNSRVGEVMYDESAGVTQRQKARQAALNRPKQQGLGLLPLLLPGIIIFFLLIFVITCIVKHRNTPFSENSLRYYNENPEFVSYFSAKDSDFAEALLKEKLNPTVAVTNFGQNEQFREDLVNQNLQQQQQLEQQALLNQNVNQGYNPYDRLDRRVNDNLNQNIENNALIQPQVEQSIQTSPPVPLSEQSGGECSEGYYLLNGVCYPCKNGYWNGTKCIVKNLSQAVVAAVNNTQLLPQTLQQNPNVTQITPPANSSLEVIPTLNPITETSRCPADSIWNGVSCQKIGSNHHLRKLLHFKRRL